MSAVFLGCSGLCCPWLELEAGLGGELGLLLFELLVQRLDAVGVSALVVRGQEVSCVRDRLGEMGDAG
jgi:hypothetical protein